MAHTDKFVIREDYYLFDIGGWDGVQNIELTNFWPDKGAISHVAIYGVPEPTNMLLLGTCLIGLAGSRLRRKKKQ